MLPTPVQNGQLENSGINIFYEPKKEDDVDFVIFSNLNNPVVRYRGKTLKQIETSYQQMSNVVDFKSQLKPSNYHRI